MSNGDRWLIGLGMVLLAAVLFGAAQCQMRVNDNRAEMIRNGCRCIELPHD